jgi:hypothetical protein
LGAGLTIQPHKKVIVTKPQRGGQGPIWAVEPYDDDDDDDEAKGYKLFHRGPLEWHHLPIKFHEDLPSSSKVISG